MNAIMPEVTHAQTPIEARDVVLRHIDQSITELAKLAETAVNLDVRARMSRHMAGDFTVHRDAREEIVELLHSRLSCLRPYIPYVASPADIAAPTPGPCRHSPKPKEGRPCPRR